MKKRRFPLKPRRFAGKSRQNPAENVFFWLQVGAFVFLSRPFFWLSISFAALLIFYFLFFNAALLAIILLPNLWSFYLHAAFSIGNNYRIKMKKSFDFLLFLIQSFFALAVYFLFYLLHFLDNLEWQNVTQIFTLFFLKFLVLFLVAVLFFVLFSFPPFLMRKHKMDIFWAIQSSITAVFKNYKAFAILFIFMGILFFIGILTAGVAFLVILPILAGTFFGAYNDIFEGV